MKIGIVGHEAAKFTFEGKVAARRIIRKLLASSDAVLVSGRSPLGGIDVWAEEIADKLGREKIIHVPKENSWAHGFKPRNLLIARDSDVCHCIVVDRVSPTYKGRVFTYCYHCDTRGHVKSGGCWTAKRCASSKWHIIVQGP